jgi:PknH-like extracellular domain
MRRLGMMAVSVLAVCLAAAGCTSTVDGTPVAFGGASRTLGTTAARDLPALLLSLDEMKQLLQFSGLVTEETWSRPDGRGVFEPAGCVGAVFSGMAGSYDGSGYRDFYEVRHADASRGGRSHWIDQGVATFENPEAAKSFVTKQAAQWRQCAGRQFRYAFPQPDDWRDPYLVGDTVASGCVTMISNVIASDKRYTDVRELAAKSNVVVDLQFTGFDLTDEPATAMNRILDRIASRGRDCAFWG